MNSALSFELAKAVATARSAETAQQTRRFARAATAVRTGTRARVGQLRPLAP